MTDRPILFSSPMVRALLDGRKTQTRRIAKVVKDINIGCEIAPSELAAEVNAGNYENLKYAPGDRLWVRETFSDAHEVRSFPIKNRTPAPLWYWADGNPTHGDWEKPRPSIFMPRWGSRLTLTVTAVRMQRLQDISRDDAISEGIEVNQDGRLTTVAWRHYTNPGVVINDARLSFNTLWDSINGETGPKSWTANPWIIAITFDVARTNIDAMPPKTKP